MLDRCWGCGGFVLKSRSQTSGFGTFAESRRSVVQSTITIFQGGFNAIFRKNTTNRSRADWSGSLCFRGRDTGNFAVFPFADMPVPQEAEASAARKLDSERTTSILRIRPGPVGHWSPSRCAGRCGTAAHAQGQGRRHLTNALRTWEAPAPGDRAFWPSPQAETPNPYRTRCHEIAQDPGRRAL